MFIKYQKNFSMINNCRVGILFISIMECYWSFEKDGIIITSFIAFFFF